MTDTTYEPINENAELSAPATKGDLYLFREEIGERFANLPTKEDFSQLLTSVDKLVGQVTTYNTERSAETYRLQRIEEWVKKASGVINVPIEF